MGTCSFAPLGRTLIICPHKAQTTEYPSGAVFFFPTFFPDFLCGIVLEGSLAGRLSDFRIFVFRIQEFDSVVGLVAKALVVQ